MLQSELPGPVNVMVEQTVGGRTKGEIWPVCFACWASIQPCQLLNGKVWLLHLMLLFFF
jgi:hypothetical protein